MSNHVNSMPPTLQLRACFRAAGQGVRKGDAILTAANSSNNSSNSTDNGFPIGLRRLQQAVRAIVESFLTPLRPALCCWVSVAAQSYQGPMQKELTRRNLTV